jgi:hypothetical protein
MPAVDLEFATTTRTGKLLQWLRADAAKNRNGSPSAEWPHPSLAAFVLAHGQPFAGGDVSSSQRRLTRSLAATHWRVHGPFQHRQPSLNAQRCLFLDDLERFVYAEGSSPVSSGVSPKRFSVSPGVSASRGNSNQESLVNALREKGEMDQIDPQSSIPRASVTPVTAEAFRGFSPEFVSRKPV